MPIFQRQALDGIPQRRLFLFRLLFPPVPVITGPAHCRRLAHLAYAEPTAALHLDLLSYRFEDAVPPSFLFAWRSSSTRRKALSKKPISICCRPTSRSSSSIRFPCPSSLIGCPRPRGLPTLFKCCSPFSTTRFFH